MDNPRTRVVIGPWTVDALPEETRRLYASVPLRSEECDCDHCLHFQAVRASIYPREALDLFDRLGIDWRKEAESVDYDGSQAPQHVCGGWFHFLGTVTGPPFPKSFDPYRDFPLITPDFAVAIAPDCRPGKAVFRDPKLPVLALEFYTKRHHPPRAVREE